MSKGLGKKCNQSYSIFNICNSTNVFLNFSVQNSRLIHELFSNYFTHTHTHTKKKKKPINWAIAIDQNT